MKYIVAALLAVVTAGCMVIPEDLLHHTGLAVDAAQGASAGPAVVAVVQVAVERLAR